MSRKYWWLGLGTVLVFGAAVAAGQGGTWVSADGDRHEIRGEAHALFIGEDDAESFDVADLADGETRILGSGEKQITATRSGDEVTLSRTRSTEADEVAISCTISEDSCKVLTFPSDPGKVLVVVEKTRVCENGVGDCDAQVELIEALPEGAKRIFVRRMVDCDEEGECSETEDVSEHPGSHAVIRVETLGAPGENVFVVGEGGPGHALVLHGDGITLRCPEGDTRMHVDEDEADEVFLCPKHSVPLEKVESPTVERLRIRKVDADDE